MRLRTLFQKKDRTRPQPKTDRKASRDETAPKNGPLTLAVAATLIIMFVLVGANLKLIRDPSRAWKAFTPWPSNSSEPRSSSAVSGDASNDDKESCYVPPRVRFYQDLTTADKDPEPQASLTENEKVDSTGDAQNTTGGPTVGNEKKDPNSATCSSAPDQRRHPSAQRVKLPKSQPGKKKYTVQVGAFTNPRIAKEWALKWKARGYAVSLKPVARPRTGVIYRLYLGSFASEKRADQLVNRLKSKEGINALRLVVRN